MKSVCLRIDRLELARALDVLGRSRRRKGAAPVPVWLRFWAEAASLQIAEDKALVTASVPAIGDWPAAGSTIDLELLKGAIRLCHEEQIVLHAVSDAVLLASGSLQVRLNLLPFGPENPVPGHPVDPHPL